MIRKAGEQISLPALFLLCSILKMDSWKVPLKVHGKESEKHDGDKSCHGAEHIVSCVLPEEHGYDTACDAGNGIYMLDEYGWDLVGKDITDDSSAYTCKDTYESDKEKVVAVSCVNPCKDTIYCKSCQTKGVKPEQELVVDRCDALGHWPFEVHHQECDIGSYQSDYGVGRCHEHHRRSPVDDKITDKSSASGCNQGQKIDTEYIHILSGCHHGTGDGKGNQSHVFYD